MRDATSTPPDNAAVTPFPWTADSGALAAAQSSPLGTAALVVKPARQAWHNFVVSRRPSTTTTSTGLDAEISGILTAAIASVDVAVDSDGAGRIGRPQSSPIPHVAGVGATSRRHSTAPRLFASSLLALPATSDPFDPEANMRTMDRLYGGTFCDFIRNEDNVMAIARRLTPLSRQYSEYHTASALRWIVNGWSLESVAKLLKIVSREWAAEYSGTVVNLVTAGWHVIDLGMFASLGSASAGDSAPAVSGQSVSSSRPSSQASHASQTTSQASRTSQGVSVAAASPHQARHMQRPYSTSNATHTSLTGIYFSHKEEDAFVHLAADSTGTTWPVPSRTARNAQLKLAAIMSAAERPGTVAAFIKALTATENWTPARVTEMVSFLDTVLEWDEPYFKEFTRSYVALTNADAAQAGQAGAPMTVGESVARAASMSADPLAADAPATANTGKISFEYLSALYKTNLALANYKAALADFKAALAARGPAAAGDGSTVDAPPAQSSPTAECRHQQGYSIDDDDIEAVSPAQLLDRAMAEAEVNASFPSVWTAADVDDDVDDDDSDWAGTDDGGEEPL